MSDLGPEARAILAAGRDGDNPSPEDRARLKRNILAGIAAGAATTAAGAAEAAGAAKVTSTLLWSSGFWKALVGFAILGAAAGGIVAATKHDNEEPPRVALPVVARAIADRKPILSTDPAEAAPEEIRKDEEPKAETPARRATASAAPAGKPPAEDADTLLAETKRLREARSALKDGDADRALALLDEASEGEKLGEERAAARVLALCKLGRVEEANAAARDFLEKNPRSPLATRVRKACPP